LNNIIVIVKNKLISTDTVLPVLIELKEKYGISSIVVVNDQEAHKGINENVVIRDAINYIGRELYIGGSISNKIIRKFVKIGWLCILFLKLITGTKVLHFGFFDIFPFNILGKIFGNRLYYLQSDAFTHSYGKFDEIVAQSPALITPNSKNVVIFNNDLSQLKIINSYHRIFWFGNTRTRESWRHYVEQRSTTYFKKYHYNIDLSRGCIVFILTSFGEMRQMRSPGGSMKMLFKNTIDVLSEVKGNIPVLIKPHVFTDLNIVNEQIQNKSNFHLTYLHPSVLASAARVFICNAYSSTMADAKSLGVRTVEYSDYKNSVIEISKGKSMGYEYIDEFINNDSNQFKKIITSIISIESFNDSNSNSNSNCIVDSNNKDDSEFLNIIATSS